MSSLNISNFIWNITDDALHDISIRGKQEWRTLFGVKTTGMFFSAGGAARTLKTGFADIDNRMNSNLDIPEVVQ